MISGMSNNRFLLSVCMDLLCKNAKSALVLLLCNASTYLLAKLKQDLHVIKCIPLQHAGSMLRIKQTF